MCVWVTALWLYCFDFGNERWPFCLGWLHIASRRGIRTYDNRKELTVGYVLRSLISLHSHTSTCLWVGVCVCGCGCICVSVCNQWRFNERGKRANWNGGKLDSWHFSVSIKALIEYIQDIHMYVQMYRTIEQFLMNGFRLIGCHRFKVVVAREGIAQSRKLQFTVYLWYSNKLSRLFWEMVKPFCLDT